MNFNSETKTTININSASLLLDFGLQIMGVQNIRTVHLQLLLSVVQMDKHAHEGKQPGKSIRETRVHAWLVFCKIMFLFNS